MRRNRGSKWETDWVRYCNEIQADQGEVLDDYYYMTSTLETFCSKSHIITIASFLDASFVEHEIVKKKWELGEKPPNPMKETGEENRKIIENILAL